MESSSQDSLSPIFLDIGGKKFETTLNTLTLREPNSMLAAMFTGPHPVLPDSETGMVFIDRDGKQFRYILNWLRDGILPTLTDGEFQELQREAKYFQLQGLIDYIKSERKDTPDFTRNQIIRMLESTKILSGINIPWLHLGKLDFSSVDLSYARIANSTFSMGNLHNAKLMGVEGEGSIFRDANLSGCEFVGAKLSGAAFHRANLHGANLKDACLVLCKFYEADLQSADLQCANLTNANLFEANLEGANLKNANLTGAILRRANLRNATLKGAKLHGADLRDADLQHADLGDADIPAIMSLFDNLLRVKLHRLGLQNADLQRADLGNVDIPDTNIDVAGLGGANLLGVI